MSSSKKRDAQSPLSGEEEDLKRRIIDVGAPALISLDETSEEEEPSDSDLTALRKLESESKEDPDKSVSDRVDSLIGRMDRFMDCFASLHTTVTKNQRSNDKKFKRLEVAHNDLATLVGNSTSATSSKIESLEAKLNETLAANSRLTSRIEQLEGDQKHQAALQKQVNETQSKQIDSLEIEQGFTNKYLHDCSSELKEAKILIAGVHESPGENTCVIALNCINKVISSALAEKHQNVQKDGLKKLYLSDISNAYRIGKPNVGNPKRTIVVSFVRMLDKEMVYQAKAITKGDKKIKFFLNDDVSKDGRVLKAKMRRVVAVAKDQGMDAKLAGNKVIIGTRAYFSNELSLLPDEITDNIKQEKDIGDRIVYRGEKSMFSNFFPAPFLVDDIDFLHVEQYYQHEKALHHNEIKTADRIMQLTNPNRIKALGDSIEEGSSWVKRRMLVLYDGARAKFEQNLPLQEELLKTSGKQLYEATTDRYFGCGIGYESNRWELKDWPGENVAGLIIKKVRDDLLGIVPEETGDDPKINAPDRTDISSQTEAPSQPNTSSSSDMSVQVQNSNPQQKSGKRGRGRNRGRGRGTKNNQNRNFHPSRQVQKTLSDAECNFLGVNSSRGGWNTRIPGYARGSSTPKR